MHTMLTGRTVLIVWFTTFVIYGSCMPAAAETVDFRYLPVRHLRDIVGDFNQPTEVAVSKQGRVYILDGANNRVKIFNRKGEMLLSFGKPGKEIGEFQQPVGMDIDGQENIYVADTGNQRIQVFDRHGKYRRMINLAARNGRPVEVELSPTSDRIYISDTNNHQILCYNKDGSFAFSWGGNGEKLGEFMYPGMADTDSLGNIHIVDILNGRLQIFGSSGENPTQFAGFGITAGKLFRPKGVVVDHRSRAYVSDSYTGVIQLFDGSGKLAGILSENNTTPLRLTTPLGMALDSEKAHLYIVQAEANKVSVFELRGGL